jgi:hypothetical protein
MRALRTVHDGLDSAAAPRTSLTGMEGNIALKFLGTRGAGERKAGVAEGLPGCVREKAAHGLAIPNVIPTSERTQCKRPGGLAQLRGRRSRSLRRGRRSYAQMGVVGDPGGIRTRDLDLERVAS